MSNEASNIVNRVWNYCHALRDDGVSYQDYLEQLTYLIFLKMDDEAANLPGGFAKKSKIPTKYNWASLRGLIGDDLEIHYRHTLENLGKESGLLGVIFRKAQNKIQDPAKLQRLISLIDSEKWMGLKQDIKGDIYEGLLQKNAEDVKSGAGQYFTPRVLIDAMVKVMSPKSDETICDPAVGTGGFLLSAYHYILNNYSLTREQQNFLREGMLNGIELVDSAARLCVMNLFLHGIGDEESPIEIKDALAKASSKTYDLILSNPPFGKKSSITIINEEGKADKEAVVYERQDFWTTTSNKQLNFLQQIYTMLSIPGRAAVVVPDNVLFEGGAGEKVRDRLMKQCDVHTLLRLPTGIFYAQGVKANVLFFDKKPGREKAWTEKLWIYDLRTNKHFTLKTNQMKDSDLEDFINCYKPENRFDRDETERFKSFSYEEILQRDKLSLDIFWLKDESLEDSANLPSPEILAQEISENLQSALEQFNGIYETLEAGA